MGIASILHVRSDWTVCDRASCQDRERWQRSLGVGSWEVDGWETVGGSFCPIGSLISFP